MQRGRDDEGGERRPPEHTVLGRSASIMEAFNGGRQVLSLADLNKRTRLPKSTLHRLVDQLCQVGWLERDHGGYRVGLRMFEIGTLAVAGNRLHEAAFPHLQALASRTGLAAQLAILDHAEVVYLERIVVGPVRLPTRRGGRKPAYCTALGKAMAAFDDDAIHALTAAPMPRKTPKTITEPAALWTELNRVRESGVAYDRGEAYEELVCVAAPIRNSGQPIGAVSVTGPAGRMRWSVAAEAVRGTAAAIWNANLSLRSPGASRRLPHGSRAGRPGGLRQCQHVPVGIQQVGGALAPRPVPQAIEQPAAAVHRPRQGRRGVVAAKVELASLAGAHADLAGQERLHVSAGHEPERCAAQVELGHARHVKHRIGGQDVTVEVPGSGLVGDVKDELRSVHAASLSPPRPGHQAG
jgi:DNA-binding IclR family transcriptional regulator